MITMITIKTIAPCVIDNVRMNFNPVVDSSSAQNESSHGGKIASTGANIEKAHPFLEAEVLHDL